MNLIVIALAAFFTFGAGAASLAHPGAKGTPATINGAGHGLGVAGATPAPVPTGADIIGSGPSGH